MRNARAIALAGHVWSGRQHGAGDTGSEGCTRWDRIIRNDETDAAAVLQFLWRSEFSQGSVFEKGIKSHHSTINDQDFRVSNLFEIPLICGVDPGTIEAGSSSTDCT
jgi:hypothetical protein